MICLCKDLRKVINMIVSDMVAGNVFFERVLKYGLRHKYT